MKQKVVNKFNHKGTEYEVRLWRDTTSYHIRVYEVATGNPADGYEYSVSRETQHNAKIDRSYMNPVGELVKVAMNSVIQNDWEAVQKALEELDK